MKRYTEWYMSSQDRPFWIWLQTSERIFDYKKYKEWKINNKPREEDLSWKKKDWNGSLMKIWPIPLFYYSDPEKAVYYWWESVKALHNTDICISCWKYFTGLVLWALQWEKKEVLEEPDYSPVSNYWENHKIHDALLPIVNWSYKIKNKSELWIKYGYVIDSLEVALRWFFNFDSFEEWMLQIVNLWYDADTNACIYWYLAWAYYGYDNIPERWKDNVTNKWLIKNLADRLYSEWL